MQFLFLLMARNTARDRARTGVGTGMDKIENNDSAWRAF